MQARRINSELVEILVNLDSADGFRALDKLALVVNDLVVGKEEIDDLLNEVGRDILALNEIDFPENLRPEFLWIREAITGNQVKMKIVPAEGNIPRRSTGTFVATSRSMGSKKASIILDRICRLYEEVRTHCYQSRPIDLDSRAAIEMSTRVS